MPLRILPFFASLFEENVFGSGLSGLDNKIKKGALFSCALIDLSFLRPDRSQHPLGLQPPPENRPLTSETLIGAVIFNCFSPQLGQGSFLRSSSLSITVAYWLPHFWHIHLLYDIFIHLQDFYASQIILISLLRHCLIITHYILNFTLCPVFFLLFKFSFLCP